MIVIFIGTAIFADLEETVGLGVIDLFGLEIKAGLEGVEVGDAISGVVGSGVGEGVANAIPDKEGLGVGEEVAIGDSFALGTGEGVGNLLGDVVGVATGDGTPVTAE